MPDTVTRTIYYYDLRFILLKSAAKEGNTYFDIINTIKNKCDKKYKNRFIKRKPTDENDFGPFEYKEIKGEPNFIAFKFIRKRKDVFPQLLPDGTETMEDMPGAENKSVVESTHVIFDYSDDKILRIGIEKNIDGPSLKEILFYLRRVGKDIKILNFINAFPITNDSLEEIANKIGDCKFLNVRVLHENIPIIKRHNKQLGDTLDSLAKFGKSKYYTLKLRLDFEENSKENNGLISSLIKLFTKNRNELEAYEAFSLIADDNTFEERTFRAFDLLMDKVKSSVTVERKTISKVIISPKMYKLMVKEYKNKIA